MKHIYKRTLIKGLSSGVNTTWTLAKVIFPVTLIVTILSHTPILPQLIQWLTPWMKWIGLPGEAAIPLVLGFFLNLYAAVGAILSLNMTVKSVFIIAVMLSFAHNMIVETSVTTKLGVKPWVMVPFRMGLALISALFINFLWQGGEGKAQFALSTSTPEVLTGWEQILPASLEAAALGVAQMALFVFPIMMFIQILKDLNWLARISHYFSPVTRLLGMEKNASLTLIAGLIFGLAFGAGVMIQAFQEDGVSKRDMYLATLFLGAAHAVIEDTLIFVPLGIPIWPLLAIRLLAAVVVTAILANNERYMGKISREKEGIA